MHGLAAMHSVGCYLVLEAVRCSDTKEEQPARVELENDLSL